MEHNFIIMNGNNDPRDVKLFFEEEPKVTFLEHDVDMFDILVRVGIFPSRSQARKNWTKTEREIPDGFTDIQKIGKQWHRITILKPIGRWEE